MVDSKKHPLVELLSFYYSSYSGVRTHNSDLSNLEFHQHFGLYLNGPLDWPYIDAIKFLMDSSSDKAITIVYSSTDMYHKIYKGIDREDDKHVGYLSFADIFLAIHRDQDLLVSIKNRIRNSDLVICAGAAGAADEVVTQIRGFCDGCLIMLG